MKKRTMIIIIAAAVVLVAAGIFIAAKGFSPYTESGMVEDNTPVAEQSEDLDPEKEADEPDLKQEEEQTAPSEENLEVQEEGGEEGSKEAQTQEESLSLKQYYDQMLNSGKPSIIVFSYDAECCESTRIFFENYNRQAYDIMERYQDSFNTLFINTGTLSSEDMQTALEIAQDKGAAALPTLLVLDSKGEAYEIFEGTFQTEDVEEVLEEVKNA
ncbi:MAG: hypothetical protein U5N58_03560 [Actinomycetota bacterium]|nr:hypothetical protein [Actinomycetota bacterium]